MGSKKKTHALASKIHAFFFNWITVVCEVKGAVFFHLNKKYVGYSALCFCHLAAEDRVKYS